ncbi:MAG: hypothetical protein JSU86_16765 [Phycisphaerales bacterium]|nr:MAG: hypothetical protein JSU86_16765 [Phycisphaerales bacterium]
MFFSPGTKLDDWNRISDGTPDGAIVIRGYQYNLSGRLMPVPAEFYNDRYLPPRPFLIEDERGELLSTLQFLPWQDGGVVLLQGKLPLNALLIFLGQEALKRGDVVDRSEAQISYVLPIGQTDFAKMLERIHRQSNMAVRQDPSSVVVQKLMDEGSRAPFTARLYIGLSRLRDVVFPDRASREIFDGPYVPILEALVSARNASRAIPQLMAAHSSKLGSGDVGRLRGHNIYVEETIDEELRREFGIFVNSAVRALKGGMQALTKALGKDIGFLFKKHAAFEDGLEKVEEGGDRELGEYLRGVRNWFERLINCRNAVEHEGWILPKVKYSEAAGVIHGDERQISDQGVSHFVALIFDRLICFVEEVTVHCLVAQMPSGITVTEVPVSEREADMPLRFQLALKDDDSATWRIVYHESPFEET